MAHINVRSWQETHHAIMSIAQSSSSADADATGYQQLNVLSVLYVLYVLASAHGIGAGVGRLDAVIEQSKAAALWLVDPNPRAWAFSRKTCFISDGSFMQEYGIMEVRMVRRTPDS